MIANKHISLSEILFRYRHWVLLLILATGFLAPWQRAAGDHPGSTWLFLAGTLARTGLLHITPAITAVMAAAVFLALLAALVRTWAAASLGTSDPQTTPAGEPNFGHQMHRYARRVLYGGLWMNTLALGILMPPGGALFAAIGVGIWAAAILKLEEHNRIQQRGPGGGLRTRWGSAFLSQIYFWGVCVTYLAVGGQYNTTLLDQGVLISFGIAVLIQGVRMPNRQAAAE